MASCSLAEPHLQGLRLLGTIQPVLAHPMNHPFGNGDDWGMVQMALF
jgi:hypothetical protein